MKARLVVVTGLVIALAAAFAVGSPSAADHDDVRGPACGDIVDATGTFDGSTVDFEVVTASPACVGITYTLNVLDIACPAESGPCLGAEPIFVASQTERGDGATSVEFSLDASSSDGDDRICVFVTTNAGGHYFDRAPESGCTIREAVADPVFGTPFDCLLVCDSCSDFVNGYILTLSPGTFVAETARPTCPGVIYTLELYNTADGSVIRSESVSGNSTAQIQFSLDLSPVPGVTLGIRATSEDARHVYDEADSGCAITEEGIVCALRFH